MNSKQTNQKSFFVPHHKGHRALEGSREEGDTVEAQAADLGLDRSSEPLPARPPTGGDIQLYFHTSTGSSKRKGQRPRKAVPCSGSGDKTKTLAKAVQRSHRGILANNTDTIKSDPFTVKTTRTQHRTTLWTITRKPCFRVSGAHIPPKQSSPSHQDKQCPESRWAQFPRLPRPLKCI